MNKITGEGGSRVLVVERVTGEVEKRANVSWSFTISRRTAPKTEGQENRNRFAPFFSPFFPKMTAAVLSQVAVALGAIAFSAFFLWFVK